MGPEIEQDRAAPVLVVVAGPQASGKSTVSTALADRLRRAGETVVLVELDAIAGMALPTLPDWRVAHAVFESVVGQWLRADVSVVVAEGSGHADEVRRLLAQARGAAALVVALEAPLEVALARAQDDPSRERSRDRAFLTGVHDRWPAERARIAPDLLIDTHQRPLDGCVDLLIEAVAAARSSPGPGRAFPPRLR